MLRDLSPVLQVSLGNNNSLSHSSLFHFSLLFRPVLLSVSSSCSFPMPFFSSRVHFSCFILLIHLVPQLHTLIFPLGFPHFHPFCWDNPFSAVLCNCFSFPWHLLGQMSSQGAGICPVVKPALHLPPPKTLPFWGELA